MSLPSISRSVPHEDQYPLLAINMRWVPVHLPANKLPTIENLEEAIEKVQMTWRRWLSANGASAGIDLPYKFPQDTDVKGWEKTLRFLHWKAQGLQQHKTSKPLLKLLRLRLRQKSHFSAFQIMLSPQFYFNQNSVEIEDYLESQRKSAVMASIPKARRSLRIFSALQRGDFSSISKLNDLACSQFREEINELFISAIKKENFSLATDLFKTKGQFVSDESVHMAYFLPREPRLKEFKLLVEARSRFPEAKMIMERQIASAMQRDTFGAIPQSTEQECLLLEEKLNELFISAIEEEKFSFATDLFRAKVQFLSNESICKAYGLALNKPQLGELQSLIQSLPQNNLEGMENAFVAGFLDPNPRPQKKTKL